MRLPRNRAAAAWPVRIVIAIAVLAVIAAACSDSGSDTSVEAAGPGDGASRPNIIMIMVDDMREIELEIGFGRTLDDWDSALEEFMIEGGTTFTNFFNPTPLCCPSRGSYLTGRYPHNHGIHENNYLPSGGNGGWRRLWEQGYDDDTVGRWMQDADYRTALVGKFLNGYPNDPDGFVPREYVPPGWDEWYASIIKTSEFTYYDFEMNENGEIVRYGPDAYLTDVERDHSVRFIQESAAGDDPFFLYLAPYAPHAPSEPAPRHLNLHTRDDFPAPPNFNEEDVSDKPAHIQEAYEAEVKWWGEGGNRRLEMTLALDEMIRAIYDELEAQGIADNTYVFFSSDNGLVREHGVAGKSMPYEESVRVPMLVTGPGVAEGDVVEHLIGNIDMAPTFLDLAGAPIPAMIDGESMVEPITGAVAAEDWRDGFLLELLVSIESPNQTVKIPPYRGVRTLDHAYVEYESGDVELYDIREDPYQLDSLHDSADPELIAELQVLLGGLYGCGGAGCAAGARAGVPNAPPIRHDCRTRECTFTAGPASDRSAEPETYTWDFGDGTTTTGAAVFHTYADGGLWAATLTVTDADGEVTAERVVSTVDADTVVAVNEVLINVRINRGTANVKATIMDGLQTPIEGAEVTMTWSVNGTLLETVTGESAAKGRASFDFADVPRDGVLEACVVDVQVDGLTYDPERNTATCATRDLAAEQQDG